MDIKGFFSDLKETMNDRLKNPFIFSFIFSWISWNWLLVYEVFNFDGILLATRINLISNYIDKHKGDNLTWYPLFSSFGIALIYLICSAVFTALFNFYNTTVKAAINKGTLRGDIIPMKDFKYLENKYDDLKKRSDRYITANNDLESKIKTNQEQIEVLTLQLSDENRLHQIVSKEKLQQDEELKVLKIKLQENQFFKKKVEGIMNEIFNDTIAYAITISDNKKQVPIEFRDISLIKFINNNLVVNSQTNTPLFIYDKVELTADGRLLGFVFKEINDVKNEFQFYMIRNYTGTGVGSMTGHMIANSNIYTVLLIANPQKSK